MVDNPRRYGVPPYRVAVIHGGPGAAGEMAPVARKISEARGVLEPYQTADSLAGEVAELDHILKSHAEPPLTLIGFSWGAMLGFIFAAQEPRLVKKLILVGSGVFEETFAPGIMETRSGRLSDDERARLDELHGDLNNDAVPDKDVPFAKLGKLIAKADAFDPLPFDEDPVECRYRIYHNVWTEARDLRARGDLLALGNRIHCPVVALHGDYDPHPADGIRIPLGRTLKNFRFILLEKCGHRPWIERGARETFFAILNEELS